VTTLNAATLGGNVSESESALRRWKLLPFAASRECLTELSEKLSCQSIRLTDDPNDWCAALRPLTWESEFFGFASGRLEPFIPPADHKLNSFQRAAQFALKCKEESLLSNLDHVSVQVHASDSIAQRGLQQAGFYLADTIVEYRKNLLEPLAEPEIDIAVANESDRAALSRIAGECFSNIDLNANRFLSDPIFSAAKVTEMYSLWATRSLDKILADEVLVHRKDGLAVGFITISLPGKSNDFTGSVPFNAVDPHFHGQGIYTELVKAAMLRLRASKAQYVEIRTQLPNQGVHKAWARLGASFSMAFHTFHLTLNRNGNVSTTSRPESPSEQ
jgi:ribosomal protein S18 acetylase RimI-like enzyme